MTYYNQREGIPSPVDIVIYIDVNGTIDVSVDVIAEDYFTGNNLKLRLALIENEYDIPGTGWTYTHCERAMLDMQPTPDGITFSITPGETVTLNTQFPIPTYPPTGIDNLGIVAFVQDDNSREVLQARYSQMPVDFPGLRLAQFYVEDETGGNGNTIPEPGESCNLWMEIEQDPIYAPATGVTATLSTDDPDITITDGEATFPDIQSGGNGDNQDNPFVFQVDPAFEAHNVTFELQITSNGGTFNATEEFTFMVGIPTIFLIDDDGGQSYEEDYIETFEEIDVTYDIWNVAQKGTPDGDFLSNYNVVLWFTGKQTSPLTAAEQDAIAALLDSGGKLFITSENLGDDIGGSDFYTNYMHAEHGQDHISENYLVGETGNPISGNTSLTMFGGAYPPDSQSSIVVADDADRIYKYEGTTSAGALSYSWEYMLVYMAFPFECVAFEPFSYTPRYEVLENILNWFDSAVQVSLPQMEAEPGASVEVPLSTGMIETASPITSFEFELHFDPAVVQLNSPMVSISGTITPSDWMPLFSSPSAGVLSGVCFGGTPLTGEGTVCNILFDVVGSMNDYTDFELVSFSYNVSVPINPVHGGLTVQATGIGDTGDELLPSEFEVVSISPNPFNPQTSIKLNIPNTGKIDIGVYNVLGERVADLYQGVMSAGSHDIIFDGANLSSGIYLLKAQTGDNILTEKMVLMK